MSKNIPVSFTRAQIEALLFACSNTLAEPANFESETGNARKEKSLEVARQKLDEALELAKF